MTIFKLSFLILLLFLIISNLSAEWNEIQKIIASDGEVEDRFGNSVSLDGDYAIVGVTGDDDNGPNSGSAHVFFKNGETWIEQAKLTASDGDAGDRFGYSVALDGDYAIIGAMLDDESSTDSGSAYVFIRNGETWIEQAKLTASDGETGDNFGCSVALDGNFAFIGASLEDHTGIDRGSAYVFYRNGGVWAEHAKLTASDGEDGDHFGLSVSLDGNYAVIGVYGDSDNGSESGSAYVFFRSGVTWIEQTKLIASDGEAGDNFGVSVSIDNDKVLVGAWDENANGPYSGSAYVFHRNGDTWNEDTKLTASDGDEGDHFGISVSIDGDYAIIGASLDDNNGSDRGSVYVFFRNGNIWSEQAKITASDGDDGDNFGVSVSLDADYALIGAYRDSDNGAESGSAYIFNNDHTNVEDAIELDKFGFLAQNYPNPFNPTTTISFSLTTEDAENVELFIYNLKGQKVKNLTNSLTHQPTNRYSVTWNGTDDNNHPVSSGIYFYKLRVGNEEQLKKMILLR